MIVSVIVAVSQNGVIGKLGKIPWHISADLQRFKKITMGHHVIMGRKTFESIDSPLKGRNLVVLSKRESYQQKGCMVYNTLKKALIHCMQQKENEAFIIGGENIFREAFSSNSIDRIYLTQLHKNYEGDTYLTGFDQSQFQLMHEEHHDEYSFLNYIKSVQQHEIDHELGNTR